jgi:hypothetical protein
MSTSIQVGEALASEVANRLETGVVLAHQHRDYCGVGLRFGEGQFIYGEVNDGLLPLPSECKYWQEAGDIERLVFPSRSLFVAWLSEQTDETLSGSDLPHTWLRRNQRLTVERLREFVNGR